jgi:hypothetical protein
VDELKGLIRDLDGDVKGLRTEAGRREASQRSRDRRRDALLGVLIVAVLVAALFIWRFVAYSNCTTDRVKALKGPANERINLFFQAYTEAAGQVGKPLTAGQKASIIVELDQARRKYTVLPAHDALVKSPTSQLLAYRDLIRSLHANDLYNVASMHHPVCTLWSV